MAAVRHLGFVGVRNCATHEVYLVVFTVVQNLVGIGSAVKFLRMREKTRFRVDFFVNRSIYPFLRRGYRSQSVSYTHLTLPTNREV